MTPTPPNWAEALLRVFLTPADFESVSGDLLEEYRDSIRPVRGESAADTWYVMQVLGFAWRSTRIWAMLLAAAFLARTAVDWLVPPVDFHTRSSVSTFLGIGLLLSAGLWSSMRSGSFFAGTVAGVADRCPHQRDRGRGPSGDLARRGHDGCDPGQRRPR